MTPSLPELRKRRTLATRSAEPVTLPLLARSSRFVEHRQHEPRGPLRTNLGAPGTPPLTTPFLSDGRAADERNGGKACQGVISL